MNHIRLFLATLLCGTVAVASRPDSSPPPSAIAPPQTSPQAAAGELPDTPAVEPDPASSSSYAEGVSDPLPVTLPDSVLDALDTPPIVSTYDPKLSRVYIDPPTFAASNDDNGYLTRAAIKDWIHDHYTEGEPFTHATVSSDPWEHLVDGTDGTHVWRDWQIEDLTEWEAKALHDATHGRLISPRSRIGAPAYQIPSTSTEGVPVYWRDGRWEWNDNGRECYRNDLYEGFESADGRYRFQDGRMLIFQIASTPQPVQASVPRPTQNYSNCPNGQCGRPRPWFRRH